MKVKVKLAARRDLPEDEVLVKAGWDLKTATPDPKDKSEKVLAEDGKTATDEPAEVKVVADQREPVTSAEKESDRTIRREEIIESDDPHAKQREEGDEEEEQVEQDSSANVLAAFKLAELEQELGLDQTLWGQGDKFERVASLEAESKDALEAQIQTLKSVKVAGLSKPKPQKASSLPRLAGIRNESVKKEANGEVPDSMIFAG